VTRNVTNLFEHKITTKKKENFTRLVDLCFRYQARDKWVIVLSMCVAQGLERRPTIRIDGKSVALRSNIPNVR
jgi:hypothetical protein